MVKISGLYTLSLRRSLLGNRGMLGTMVGGQGKADTNIFMCISIVGFTQYSGCVVYDHSVIAVI